MRNFEIKIGSETWIPPVEEDESIMIEIDKIIQTTIIEDCKQLLKYYHTKYNNIKIIFLKHTIRDKIIGLGTIFNIMKKNHILNSAYCEILLNEYKRILKELT